MSEYKSFTTEETLAAIQSRIREGRDFFRGQTTAHIVVPKGQTLASFDVLFGSVVRTVRIIDNERRPPDPDGVWIDDLLSAACRNIAGVTRGSCRRVQGSDTRFEFREYWHEPTRYKVVEQVTVEYAPSMQRPSEKIIVSTTAYPGADVSSVVFASSYLLLERKFGRGTLEWAKRQDCRLRFEANPASAAKGLVQCRYTIVLNGGTSREIVINIPAAETRNWESIRNAVSSMCRPMFGPGTLQYAPELGEVSFRWK